MEQCGTNGTNLEQADLLTTVNNFAVSTSLILLNYHELRAIKNPAEAGLLGLLDFLGYFFCLDQESHYCY